MKDLATQGEELKSEISPVVSQANSITVASPEQAEHARDIIRAIKDRRGKVDATFDGHIKAAHAAHKALVATKKSFADDLDAAEKIIKGKIGNYQLECERIAREEAEKARRLAEEERQKEIAAAQRIIDRAVASTSKLETQIEELKKIRDDLTQTEQARMLAERQIEVLRLKQQGAEDRAQEAQRRAEMAVDAPVITPVAESLAKTSGVGVKKSYSITVTDPLTLIKAIAGGQGSPGLVKEWDATMLKKLALMGIFLPGVAYTEERKVSVSRR